jgi:hypothetical protein
MRDAGASAELSGFAEGYLAARHNSPGPQDGLGEPGQARGRRDESVRIYGRWYKIPASPIGRIQSSSFSNDSVYFHHASVAAYAKVDHYDLVGTLISVELDIVARREIHSQCMGTRQCKSGWDLSDQHPNRYV